MSNLKSVLAQLSSDKIKERQEGITALRDTFSQDRALGRVDSDGSCKTWLVIFQRLFEAVAAEKALYDKKPSDVAERRLRAAASTVRWLTERVVNRLNKKVVKALLAQLLSMIVHRGDLYAPVALDYAKALNTIISFQPHMDHLDDDNWVTILELAFNVLLCDPLRSRLNDNDIEMEDSLFDGQTGSDDEFQDYDANNDNIPSTSLAAKSRKRRRGTSPSSPQSTPLRVPSARRRQKVPHAASNEQVEFAAIILVLVKSQTAPLLSPEHPYLASAVLIRLQRFLSLYPTETSLHRDYLLSVSATLSHLALNKRHDVEKFARHVWSSMVDLWGTGAKSRWTKEALVPVLRTLFPFLTSEEHSSDAWKDGVSRLWHLLDSEAMNRWGIDRLSLESLRLEIGFLRVWDEDPECGRPFVARTFRAGWQFDSGQALAWAILELQADCTEKLFVLSESVHSEMDTGEGKRVRRLENPVITLLSSIERQTKQNIRAYHLQILLFFVDRHWSILHDAIQQDIINTLLQFVSSEDGVVQSWTFLCLAAIANMDGSPCPTTFTQNTQSQSLSNGRSRDAITWDPIWTHSIRRANVPMVCRAACHAAFVLLLHAKRLLTSSRVLVEIESLSKDVDVQGPSFPYDSVCAFFAKCLAVVSQDVRLYRMRLEEKVLSWLMGSWRIESERAGQSKMALHNVADMLVLLEAICGFSKRSDLICRVLLPECPITDTLVEEKGTAVIREFLLHARLPSFQRSPRIDEAVARYKCSSDTERNATSVAVLVEPVGRERKVSAFILHSLEALISEWDAAHGLSAHKCTAERARRSVDMAILAFSFESLLVLNGTRSTKRVMQAAGALLLAVQPLLINSKWTIEEQALVLLGLDPLTAIEREIGDVYTWVAMLPPDVGSGIRSETLTSLRSAVESQRDEAQQWRRKFQRTVWQDIDLQKTFQSILPALKNILRRVAGETGSATLMGVGYNESFGTAAAAMEAPRVLNASATCYVMDICVSFLTTGPLLETSSGEPTRDRELTQLVLNCPYEHFFLIAPVFFGKVRQGILHLSPSNLGDFLAKIQSLVHDNYTYDRSERALLLLIYFLQSTLRYWLQENTGTGGLAKDILPLLKWLSHLVKKKLARSWKIRDAIATFFDDLLSHDPEQRFWRAEEGSSPEGDESFSALLPSGLLPQLGADVDIRVRFRAAIVNARLISNSQSSQVDIMVLYSNILDHLTKEINQFELMLTRMLALGNIMVVSSAVRRGPYWHLLEACLHRDGQIYHRHVISIVHGVSERMGLAPSTLFDVYASQIAYSIRQAGHDFLQFPPHVLGYEDRRDCAEKTFRAFTPTNVLATGPNADAMAHGKKLFANHCRAVHKSIADGLRECFGDIIGIQIVSCIDEDIHKPSLGIVGLLEGVLRDKTTSIAELSDFDDLFNQNVDGVVAAILRSLSDYNTSGEGPIIRALRSVDDSGEASRAFLELTRHRRTCDFLTHEPNLPAFPVDTVLRALEWLFQWRPSIRTKMHAIAYHVLHELLADIQRSPLVNEQIRMMNALCLWVAYCRTDFTDSTLLHTLIQGASSLLIQSDLARAAQSVLEWSFVRYRMNERKDSRFPDILIRISCAAHDHARSNDTPTSALGHDLLRWIDLQAVNLCRVHKLRGQVSKALPAWPHQPSPELTQIHEDITSETLSALLGEHRISSSKFRLVRRLQDHAISRDYPQQQFSATDFWRLKACIPPAEQLQDLDIDAFTNLLVLNQGRIDGFGTEQHLGQSVRDRHRRGHKRISGYRETSGHKDTISPEHSIVSSLLDMLHCSSLAQVHTAYRTLRFLVSSSDWTIFDLEQPEYRDELEFLRAFPRIPRSNPNRDLMELIQLDVFSTLTEFPEWVSSFAALLSDVLSTSNLFYAQLTPLLQSDIILAEQMLPVLIHTLLHAEAAENRKSGRPVRNLLSQYLTSILHIDPKPVARLRCVVDIVLHLRNFQPDGAHDALAYDKWLDIDFSLLAKAAVFCGAFTTALLFLELATEHSDPSQRENSDVEQMLFDIYSHIDEPDGFYGIQSNDLRHFLLKRFHHEKQWEKAFRFHGAALEAEKANAAAAEGLLQSFHAFGFDHLAIGTLQEASLAEHSVPNGVSGMSYWLGWRTETWDLPDHAEEGDRRNSLYLALRAVHRERDQLRADLILRRALSVEMGRLREVGLENMAEIRQVTQNLMCLRQVSRWRQPLTQDRLAMKCVDLNDWEDFTDISCDFEFSDLESIMATRMSLVRSARQKEERNHQVVSSFALGLAELETKCLVRLSEAARNADQIQIALNSIVRAQQLDRTTKFDVSQEFANVLWLQNEQKSAIQSLKDLVLQASSGPGIDSTKKAMMLARLGSWTAEACLEKPTDILKNFFEPAIQQISAIPHEMSASLGTSYASVYHQCATFAEHQYNHIVKSPDAKRWNVYVDLKTKQIRDRGIQLQKLDRTTPTFQKMYVDQTKAEAQLKEDKQLYLLHEEAREKFLIQAIDMCARCLEASDEFDDDAAIRLCSLWFANFDDGKLQDVVCDALNRVASRKFVFLAHQLSARLLQSQTAQLQKSQENLQALIIRMCREHPFHSIHQVYCLRVDGPSRESTEPRRQSSRLDVTKTQTERGIAASDILDQLRQDPTNGERVRAIETVCDACLEWAKFPIKNDKRLKRGKLGHEIPQNLQILTIRAMRVPVLTVHTPLDPTMQYNDCIWIDHYDAHFDTAGGINLPKINRCVGSDGVKYKQLFKGEGDDDLRQDAVMEQVFDLVNVVLRRDRETRRRSLNIRTYKVIPLAAQAGMLEFVNNTSVLQTWLHKAHHLYRPQDLKCESVVAQLKEKRDEYKKGPYGPIIALYKRLCERVKPVMRHYFTERHKNPIAWFAMRLTYTRSVATTSIVGHILGIGDRHTSNILLDNGTGQVVHIDFGFAFDQGKLLPVPERVPFRMTRDMVDGMGTSGTQGVFQRCAEETLRVLREGSDVILTVLEVFRHDPLHQWTASEVKVYKVQNVEAKGKAHSTATTARGGGGGGGATRLHEIGLDMNSGTAEEAADRALSSVARKLDKTLSVEYTVNELIAEATDVENLALIYSGWSPHL